MIDPATKNDPIPASEDIPLTADNLRAMIKGVRPKGEVYTGIRFLERLLEAKGVNGVLGFIAKAVKALDSGDGLDLAFDFDPAEKEIFGECRPNMTRGNFLRTIGYGVPGIIFGTKGVISLAARAEAALADAPPEHTSSTRRGFLENARDVVGGIPMDIADIFIGGALLNEAREKWLEIKLEQIADAVSVLDERLKEEKKPTPPTR